MDFFAVKILSKPSPTFLLGVLVSAAVNIALAFAFAWAITSGIEAAL